VPNALEPQWLERGARPGTAAAATAARAIDVLVQRRKSSAYVLQQLVPALRARGLRVEVQDGWVDDLVDLFNSAMVYLYDSADHWRGRGVSEGFGLPPIEALACGCVVFSSLNHALADLLDPGLVGHQIGCGTLEADLERIAAAAAEPRSWQADPQALQQLLIASSEPALLRRWANALERLDAHWRRMQAGVLPLRSRSLSHLRWAQGLTRLSSKARPIGWLAGRLGLTP
jgi:glycosyltransferase involved in cell wall biosynthesis